MATSSSSPTWAAASSLGLLSAQTTRAYLDDPQEIGAVSVFAERHGLAWTYDREALTAELRLRGPADQEGAFEDYCVLADFEDYRTVPPLWRFVDPRTKELVGPAAYPRPDPPGRSSVFHGSGVICAPWNRGAYRSEGGPHDNWGGLENWQSVSGSTIAQTVPDMIDRIYRETTASRGRMASLPSHT